MWQRFFKNWPRDVEKLVVGKEMRSAVAEMGDRLATIDMGQKLGCCAPLGEGSWVAI